MKLALIIAVYNRTDLESVVLNRFKKQSVKYGFEIIVAGSEGDISKGIAEGCHYIEVENNPVSKKHNAMLTKAKELKVDGVCLFGSDDMVNDAYFDYIYSLNKNESELIGLDAIYFHDTLTQQLSFFNPEDRAYTIGAGRFFSKKVLDKMNWQLWDNDLNKGLDHNCSNRLRTKGIGEKVVSLRKNNIFMVDIKHMQSITNRVILEVGKRVPYHILTEGLGHYTIEKIKPLYARKLEISGLNIKPTDEVMVIGTGKKNTIAGHEYLVSGETALILIAKGVATLKYGYSN